MDANDRTAIGDKMEIRCLPFHCLEQPVMPIGFREFQFGYSLFWFMGLWFMGLSSDYQTGGPSDGLGQLRAVHRINPDDSDLDRNICEVSSFLPTQKAS